MSKKCLGLPLIIKLDTWSLWLLNEFLIPWPFCNLNIIRRCSATLREGERGRETIDRPNSTTIIFDLFTSPLCSSLQSNQHLGRPLQEVLPGNITLALRYILVGHIMLLSRCLLLAGAISTMRIGCPPTTRPITKAQHSQLKMSGIAQVHVE